MYMKTSGMTAAEVVAVMKELGDERQAVHLAGFFKTGKGQYGEGDRFLGVRVPQTRAVARQTVGLSWPEVEQLLLNPWHEIRLCGFLILVLQMKALLPTKKGDAEGNPARRDALAAFYLEHARWANNWDLVDLSAEYVIGEWLLHPSADGALPDRSVLDRLAGSDNLWEQRIAIVSTWMLIHHGEFADTLRIAALLLSHPHDLIHKAVGWMLREVGKRDITVLRGFLEEHAGRMPRTMLRYAIEKMSADERTEWLHRRDGSR